MSNDKLEGFEIRLSLWNIEIVFKTEAPWKKIEQLHMNHSTYYENSINK